MVVFGNLAILHESKICGRDRGDEGGAMLLKLTFKVVVIVTLFWLESLLCIYIYRVYSFTQKRKIQGG